MTTFYTDRDAYISNLSDFLPLKGTHCDKSYLEQSMLEYSDPSKANDDHITRNQTAGVDKAVLEKFLMQDAVFGSAFEHIRRVLGQ